MSIVGLKPSIKLRAINLYVHHLQNSCPEIRKKNSQRLKFKHEEAKAAGKPWRILTEAARASHGWKKGLTKLTDSRVDKAAKAQIGKRRITDVLLIDRMIYNDSAAFNLAGIVTKIKGYNLLLKHGMYHRKLNLNGVVRDHRISRAYGYKHKIEPLIIGHPANCEFILHKENARKSLKNSITLDELLIEIEIWNKAVVAERYTH